MPARTFAILLVSVIAAAGLTLLMWTYAGLPLAALGVAALCAGLITGWRGRRRQ
jgi:hypothetical protein